MINYTVTEINRIIKKKFDDDRFFSDLYVKGEITNCKYYPSGHIYFSMKDSSGQISCVMFAGNRAGLKFKLEDGMSVVAHGNIGVYEATGKYQLYVRSVEKEGLGDLFKKYEEMKARLDAEGLFNREHKLKLPNYAMKIGIVTSEAGAVIHDICDIAKRRNPFVKLFLYPCAVQGAGAAATVIEGIRYFEKAGVDIIIFGRGGGSAEDLFEFNDEALARCIYDCTVPTVSAVGHESDYSISDLVADVRAATPSEAAELCVFSYNDVMDRLAGCRSRLDVQMDGCLRRERDRLKKLSLMLEVAGPIGKLDSIKKKRDLMHQKLRMLFERRLEAAKSRERILAGRIAGLSPAARLAGGYSYVSDPDGKCLRSVEGVAKGDRLRVYVTDGMIESEVVSVHGKEDGNG